MADYSIREEDIDPSDDAEPETFLAILLAERICWISSIDYVDPRNSDRKTCGIVVNCNDLFYWACADVEGILNDEIIPLYRAWKANPKWGVDKWCCLHRGLRPQRPIVADMQRDGFWDDELAALPAPAPS